MAKRNNGKKTAPTGTKKGELEARAEEIASLNDARARILCGREADQSLSWERVKALIEEHDQAARRGDLEKCKEVRRKLMSTRAQNWEWAVVDDDGKVPTWDRASVAVLMDLRDRLDTLLERLPAQQGKGA